MPGHGSVVIFSYPNEYSYASGKAIKGPLFLDLHWRIPNERVMYVKANSGLTLAFHG